jgi:PPOX class probable F420-dependent enzyme
VAPDFGFSPYAAAVDDPQAERPFMPGYGIGGPDEGTGLLPWRWAEERLISSHHYWVVSRWPDGRPHAMPVWGVWDDGALWFSSGGRSRKVLNLMADPRCVVTIQDTTDPVVVEGTAEIVTEAAALARTIDLVNVKYSTKYTVDFLDPAVNATVRVRPRWAFWARAGRLQRLADAVALR